MNVTYLPVHGHRRRKATLKAVHPDGTAIVIDTLTRRFVTCPVSSITPIDKETK